MKIILSTLKKILFWSYERGSWQYDVMCVLILAFIFLSPNHLFESKVAAAPVVVSADEIGIVDSNDLEKAIKDYLHKKGHSVSIARIETAEDSSGKATYVVYEK